MSACSAATAWVPGNVTVTGTSVGCWALIFLFGERHHGFGSWLPLVLILVLDLALNVGLRLERRRRRRRRGIG